MFKYFLFFLFYLLLSFKLFSGVGSFKTVNSIMCDIVAKYDIYKSRVAPDKKFAENLAFLLPDIRLNVI